MFNDSYDESNKKEPIFDKNKTEVSIFEGFMKAGQNKAIELDRANFNRAMAMFNDEDSQEPVDLKPKVPPKTNFGKGNLFQRAGGGDFIINQENLNKAIKLFGDDSDENMTDNDPNIATTNPFSKPQEITLRNNSKKFNAFESFQFAGNKKSAIIDPKWIEKANALFGNDSQDSGNEDNIKNPKHNRNFHDVADNAVNFVEFGKGSLNYNDQLALRKNKGGEVSMDQMLSNNY